MTGARGRLWIAAAGVLAILSILLLWPGVATYDTLSQYGQAISGRYDDWHPPIMARLWGVLLGLGLPGTGPMLAVQLGLYWLGFGLIAGALARAGRPWLAATALALGALPPVAGWMIAVLKDCQLVAALVAASGIVAWRRLDGRALGPVAGSAVALLGGYAILARANSAFGVVPLLLAWTDWQGLRRPWPRALLLGAATLAAIGVSGPINHRLLGADASGVERVLPLYDMAGIAHFARLRTIPQLAPARWAAAEARGCYTPFYWDPYTDATKCGWVASTVALGRDDDAPSIFGDWARMVAAHPLAYAEHRLAHLNSTLRVAMPADERIASSPGRTDPNPAGIGLPPRATAYDIAVRASRIDETPIGSPAVWLVLACGLWWVLAGTPRSPARDLALAVALSATLQTASFAVVSIASDLRYHLWLMTGTAIAAVLAAAAPGLRHDRLRIALALAVVAGLASIALRA